MTHPRPDPELALAYLDGQRDPGPLFAEARRLRDEGKGNTVTYSRKVFIPLTTLCRDRCTYCTFAQPPGAGGMYLTPDEVLAVARAGSRQQDVAPDVGLEVDGEVVSLPAPGARSPEQPHEAGAAGIAGQPSRVERMDVVYVREGSGDGEVPAADHQINRR